MVDDHPDLRMPRSDRGEPVERAMVACETGGSSSCLLQPPRSCRWTLHRARMRFRSTADGTGTLTLLVMPTPSAAVEPERRGGGPVLRRATCRESDQRTPRCTDCSRRRRYFERGRRALSRTAACRRAATRQGPTRSGSESWSSTRGDTLIPCLGTRRERVHPMIPAFGFVGISFGGYVSRCTSRSLRPPAAANPSPRRRSIARVLVLTSGTSLIRGYTQGKARVGCLA